ncbi:MAG: formylmethanofuran dehydrogenase subunit B [Euryarchaeota archaeon]|nr:formylmethanofuran dehydrogenase subunit B [Euryarchaeota archaeon]
MATDIVCPFCGTLCDDLEVVVEDNKIKNVKHACKLGSAKFLNINEGHRFVKPLLRKNGNFVEVEVEEAINEAAKILASSKRPLLFGWATTSCEAHRVGIALAEELGAIIDSCTSVCHGPSELALHDVGYPTVTLGEVKNRADLVIYWGANPMHAHPRHLSRYSIFPRGYFRERGSQDRELIVVDVRKTDTAKIANKFIQVKPGQDYELLGALRVIVNGGDIAQEEVAGIAKEEVYAVAEKMKNCQWGIIFFGQGLTMSPGKIRNIDNAISLTKDLNRYTKFSIMMMRGHYNVTGFSEVLAWQCGYPFAVDFSRGYPRYNPGETAANDVLQRGAVDAALIVGSDPVSHFPQRSVERLAKIPLIAVEPHWTPTTELADVIIPSAIVGIEVEGTAYRMDTVPIRMRKVVEPPAGILTDEQILELILKKVREKRA